MNELIRNQGMLAMELQVPYSPVIHNPETIANLMYLDGHFCSAEWRNKMESALIILLKMKVCVN